MDKKQVRLLNLVFEKIVFYYKELYGTQPRYRHPLSLWRLKKLCNRSNQAVTTALHYLANTVPLGSHTEPAVYYDRIAAVKNKSHRPYRIFLRKSESFAIKLHKEAGAQDNHEKEYKTDKP